MSRQEKILIVDDETNVRLFLTELLQTNGYTTIDAASAEEALRLLPDRGLELVISDVNMPGKSGLDLLAEIQSHPCPPSVIIMTGKPSIEAAVDCMKIGAADYLPKPVEMDRLLATVRDVLNRRQREMNSVAATVAIGHAIKPPGLAGYSILRTLGTGNMGIVFLAEKQSDKDTGQFAVKIIKPDLLEGDPEHRQKTLDRFCREAACASRITHPGVVKVLEHGLFGHDQVPYMIMEYFEGLPLDKWSARTPTPDIDDKTRVLRDIAGALHAIHEQGVSHRDIKPANILVGAGDEVKLTDFGVAQAADFTLTTSLTGTPAYMAPETFRGARPAPAADVFSLGVVAYELYLGARPFKAESIPALAQQICIDCPEAPCSIDTDFPPALQDLLARMLKKKPKGRCSAVDVARSLQSYLDMRGETAAKWKTSRKSWFGRDWK